MRNLHLLLTFGILISLFSCTSNKKLTYIQGNYASGKSYNSIDTAQYRLKTNDQLHIKIQGLGVDNEVESQFNVQRVQSTNTNNISLFLSSYQVDEEGNIILPMIGKQNVKGLSIEQARKNIDKEISKYLKNFTITIKLVNFKITVLGEVKTPGLRYVYEEQISIFQALGMAGDLTEFGNRKEVRIVRNVNGKNTIYNLDITRPDIVASAFYYLQPNDVIYIQPLATRRYGLDDNWVQIALSAATTLILFLNYFTN